MAGQISRGARPKGRPHCLRTVFSLGRPLTGHNWAAPLLLIDRTPFRRLLILALLLISGNVHPNPGPISNHPHPRYPCSICHLDVGRDSLQCSACLKWVHFLCSSLTRADFRTICAAGTTVGWRCPACHPQNTTDSPTQTSLLITPPASPPPPPPDYHNRPVGRAKTLCSGRSEVETSDQSNQTQCFQRLATAATFLRKELCCPGAMTQRWAPQTRYTFRHNTASIMKDLNRLQQQVILFYDFQAQ